MKQKTFIKTILIILVTLTFAKQTFAYPPENAAVLYQQACLLSDADQTMKDMLSDYINGEIESNEIIKEFVNKNRILINIVNDAAEIQYCDWGIDYSLGYELELPQIPKFRPITCLLLSDAKLLAEQGDYTGALNQCLTIYKMANHANDMTTISHLVAIAISAKANNVITQILSNMPTDIQTLSWLKNELQEIQKKPLPSETFIEAERQVALMYFSPERVGDLIQFCELEKCDPDDKIKKRIQTADQQFCEINKTYWNNHLDRLKAAQNLPYPQAYQTMKDLKDQTAKELDDNPAATLTAIQSPNWQAIHSISTRHTNHVNVLSIAIEIYIINAKTRKLPDALPQNMPKDLFSEKPFIYKKNTDGFTLKCQAKDLNKNKTYEYEFKIKK